MSTTEQLERVVAEAADFLEAIGEDLRVAAIMASADEQPRRAAALGNAAVRAARLSDEIGRAWAASHHDRVCSVDLRTLDPACSADECYRFRHGSQPFCEGVCLRAHPNVAPDQIAKIQAEDMADKGYSVPITDVCEALGISSTSALSNGGDVEHVPIDRLTLLAKLRALRELREATVNAALAGAIEVSRRTQIVEDGLLQRALAKIAETDRAWLERELGAKS